jgi:N-acetyl-anhydromuramyl-L-alanine amidase AmpD
MGNSPLVNYTKISPNKTSPRNHVIDTITIHCVSGQCSVQTLGDIFAPTERQASSNYGIGFDGKIGMYCEEKDRSWCSSSSSNDNRAITIEVASDTTEPYAVNDKAYNALIVLIADICKRNNIKELKWKGDKSLIGQVDKQNMTVHRWFAQKSCPGNYLYNLHGQIAKEVNVKLNPAAPVNNNGGNKTVEVLKLGSKGTFVIALQKKLNKLGYALIEDGDFGANTEKAVKDFQAKNNLDVDGFVGNDTMKCLDSLQNISQSQLLVKAAIKVGLVTDEKYWTDVLEGKIQPNPEYLKVIFSRATKTAI